MATKTIPWNTGEGNICVTYTGSGNGTLSVYSDTQNESPEERSQVITLRTTDGTPTRTVSLVVRQIENTIYILKNAILHPNGKPILLADGTPIVTDK